MWPFQDISERSETDRLRVRPGILIFADDGLTLSYRVESVEEISEKQLSVVDKCFTGGGVMKAVGYVGRPKNRRKREEPCQPRKENRDYRLTNSTC